MFVYEAARECELSTGPRFLRIGFIGAGKAGVCFGRYLVESAAKITPEEIEATQGAPFTVSGYLSRNPASASAAALATGKPAFSEYSALAAASDLILVTTPDDRIADVWEILRPQLRSGLFVGHMSGSFSSEVFAGAAEAGVHAGSMHPLASFASREADLRVLRAACFTIEGDAVFLEMAGALLTKLGNSFAPVAAREKALYHAAGATVSNLVVAVAQMGAELFRSCGLPEDFAEHCWRPLFLENAKNIASLGPVASLTGPVERGDIGVIREHLAVLRGAPEEVREAYRSLSLIAAEIARERHPGRDDSELIALLQEADR